MRLVLSEPRCYTLFYNYAQLNPYETFNELVKDIERALGVKIFPPKELSIEFSPEIPRNQARGIYDPVSKTIILFDNLWCRKTFIHEVLHAASYFTHDPELLEISKREEELIEGITEFLTGYVLFSNYRDCYNAWINKQYLKCNISYENYVKLLGAALHVLISLSDIIRIYIYNPIVDWREEYQKFLSKYEFNDFLVNKPKKKKVTSLVLLGDMIVKTLRKRSKEKVNEFLDLLYEAPLSIVLDYQSMMR